MKRYVMFFASVWSILTAGCGSAGIGPHETQWEFPADSHGQSAATIKTGDSMQDVITAIGLPRSKTDKAGTEKWSYVKIIKSSSTQIVQQAHNLGGPTYRQARKYIYTMDVTFRDGRVIVANVSRREWGNSSSPYVDQGAEE